jgi:GGDEF domain-containing protein
VFRQLGLEEPHIVRELLEACLDLDVLAEEVYRRFANDTDDATLAILFEQMRADEDQHSIWWTELLGACVRGDLVTSIEPDPHVVTYLRAVVTTVRCTLATRFEGFSDEDRLAVAASLEYFGLDPVFGQLINETDPTGRFGHRAAYDEHLDRLVHAMESRRAWALVSQIALLRAVGVEPAGSTRLRDDRTGLPSGEAAAAVLTELCTRESARGEFVSLALLDMGDTMGCIAPSNRSLDEALCAATSVMQRHFGPGDLIFRDARGRFGAVMPAATSDVAGRAAEGLVEALREQLATDGEIGARGMRVKAAVLTVAPGAPARFDAHAMLDNVSGVLERLRSDDSSSVGVLNFD